MEMSRKKTKSDNNRTIRVDSNLGFEKIVRVRRKGNPRRACSGTWVARRQMFCNINSFTRKGFENCRVDRLSDSEKGGNQIIMNVEEDIHSSEFQESSPVHQSHIP